MRPKVVHLGCGQSLIVHDEALLEAEDVPKDPVADCHHDRDLVGLGRTYHGEANLPPVDRAPQVVCSHPLLHQNAKVFQNSADLKT